MIEFIDKIIYNNCGKEVVEMNKKKLMIIIPSIIIVILVSLGIIFYPKYIEKKNISNLNKEIVLINDYLNGKREYDEINNYLKEDITTSKMIELEKSIENYINNLCNRYSNLNESIKHDKIDINNINNELEKSLNDSKKKVQENKEKLEEVINNKSDYLLNKEFSNLYEELIDKISLKYEDIVNEYNNWIDKEIESIKFLNSKKDWKIENEKIIFTKRNIFDEYNKLNNNNLEYELIKDTTGPNINASNITIIKGNKINLKDKFKCYDNVDDNVECNITGNYDNNKIGTYNIKITARDKSGNTNNKTIKLTVKEEKKNPYYVEVIRNHNVVIVYGLDSNNKYTKIVKVFICSVGKNGKTPTGTFKTSDKSSWGRLVGNVYGQYYTRIVGDILFHSVPYFKKDKSTLEWEEYNKLGTGASKGCVRLSVRDVKWIYDNLPRGTTVKIYDGNLPSGVSKPSSIKIDENSPNKGWDPTDPDKKNPWR